MTHITHPFDPTRIMCHYTHAHLDAGGPTPPELADGTHPGQLPLVEGVAYCPTCLAAWRQYEAASRRHLSRPRP